MKPEQQFHQSVATYLNVVLEACVFWSTIAHGGFKLPVSVARNLKRAGLKAGTPDILIVHEGRALFLELKAPKGKLSPAQIDTHYAILKAQGHVKTVKTLREVKETLALWKVPTREAA